MDVPAASITVRYSSSRREVWRTYWRAWARPRGLWRFHVVFGAVGGATRALGSSHPAGDFVEGFLVVFASCLLLFPFLTQLKFKPAQREFTIDAGGWTTAIGTSSGSRRWSEVRAVVDAGEVIEIVGTSGNAIVVPRRAFADAGARAEFLAAAIAWHADAPV